MKELIFFHVYDETIGIEIKDYFRKKIRVAALFSSLKMHLINETIQALFQAPSRGLGLAPTTLTEELERLNIMSLLNLLIQGGNHTQVLDEKLVCLVFKVENPQVLGGVAT